jgi:hypothetical protein
MGIVTFTLAEDEYVSAGKLSYLDFFRRRPSQSIMLFGCLTLASIAVGSFLESSEDGNATWLRYGLVLVAVVAMLVLSYLFSVPLHASATTGTINNCAGLRHGPGIRRTWR